MTDAFAREYLGTWSAPSADERFAYEVWLEYHETCERHDRIVCTGPIGRGGGRLPANGYQQASIARHAARVHRDARWLLRDVDPDVSRRERERALRDHEGGEYPRTKHLLTVPTEQPRAALGGWL
jgi:hypothetical protein